MGSILDVSIHAPRTGRDMPAEEPPAGAPSFNPRAPHGARLNVIIKQDEEDHVSIHAPRTGRDQPHA